MVGDRIDSDAHHTPAQVRQDAEPEYDGVLFSNKYAGRGDLFEGLAVWNDERYRQLQGTYPVIFMSFAGIKANNVMDMKAAVKIAVTNVYGAYKEMMRSDKFDGSDRESFAAVNERMDDVKAYTAIHSLCI